MFIFIFFYFRFCNSVYVQRYVIDSKRCLIEIYDNIHVPDIGDIYVAGILGHVLKSTENVYLQFS